MSKVEVIGRLPLLDEVLDALHSLSAVHVVDAAPPQKSAPPRPPRRDAQERARVVGGLLTRVEELLREAPPDSAPSGPAASDDEDALRARLDVLAPPASSLIAAREALRAEQETLPRYLAALEHLLPLAPEVAALDDETLRRLGLATVVAVLDSADPQLPALLERDLDERLGSRVAVTTGRLDERTVGVVVLYAHEDAATVHAVLGKDQVAHATLPDDYASHGLRAAIAAMRERAAQLRGLADDTDRRLAQLLEPSVPALRAARGALADELAKLQVSTFVSTTDRTFAVAGWLPSTSVASMRTVLADRFDGELVVSEVDRSADDPSAPVLLRNRSAARPYEALVSFLALPRSGSTDPTTLMALALPTFFGMMVGDLGYGVLLLVLAWLVRRRLGDRTAIAADVSRILTACAGASIVFGLLFGEFFGSLGNKLGMPALWFYRGGPDALQPLLLLALGMGAAHIVLALLLGIWQSVKDRRRHAAAERIGTLLVLVGLFGFAAATVAELPEGLFTVKIAAIVVGVVLVTSLGGLLGLVTGPLELLGVIGNILSYLRLAAVGLASVYLANVANELAVIAPLGIGIVVAVFFHALNLALAAFSPLIQALRLHYVEMFSKFFEPGGQPYTPFGRRDTPATAPVGAAVGRPDELPLTPAGTPPDSDLRTEKTGEPSWK